MADPKHTALQKHLQNAQAAHKQTGDSLTKIAEIIGALKSQAQPQQPTAPGMTAGPVSPLGGQAQ